MRKFLALALSCILLVATLASCAVGLGDPDAINNYTPEVKTITTDKGVFTFEEAEGDTAILVGYNGRATKDDHVEIPTEFNGRPVVGIGNNVFYNLAAVVEVKIPATVTSIGDYAFANCTELTSVTLPDGLLSIGFATFTGCTKLETVNLGNSLVSIGDSAFKSCPVLKNIALPATLESIGEYAFAYDEALTEFAAPAALKDLGTLAFYNCTGLTSIKLSDTLENIGEYAFVTEKTTMKAIIDTTSYSEGSKAAEYVAAMADTVIEETEAPEDNGVTDPEA
ncbi:MAG: leucine-rich repeat domain-containing protein [Clostridia bacterium]|nr:leucine-rich repeat domain-containing protein [Clostridia bacterium]